MPLSIQENSHYHFKRDADAKCECLAHNGTQIQVQVKHLKKKKLRRKRHKYTRRNAISYYAPAFLSITFMSPILLASLRRLVAPMHIVSLVTRATSSHALAPPLLPALCLATAAPCLLAALHPPPLCHRQAAVAVAVRCLRRLPAKQKRRVSLL